MSYLKEVCVQNILGQNVRGQNIRWPNYPTMARLKGEQQHSSTLYWVHYTRINICGIYNILHVFHFYYLIISNVCIKIAE